MQQRAILDDQIGRMLHLVATKDRRLRDAHEGHDRCSASLGAEGGEGLALQAGVEGGGGQQVGGDDIALSAAAVDANLDHASASCADGVVILPTQCRLHSLLLQG